MSLNDDEEVDGDGNEGNDSVGSIENRSLNGKIRQSVPQIRGFDEQMKDEDDGKMALKIMCTDEEMSPRSSPLKLKSQVQSCSFQPHQK